MSRLVKAHRCRYCETTDSNEFSPKKKGICKRCFYLHYVKNKLTPEKKQKLAEQTAARRLANKLFFMAEFGFKCAECGTVFVPGVDNPADWGWHHLQPETKDPNWPSVMSWKRERIREELKKCILVDNKCHNKMHNHAETREQIEEKKRISLESKVRKVKQSFLFNGLGVFFNIGEKIEVVEG